MEHLADWEVRSSSVAAMLNPSLGSLLLSSAAYGYKRVGTAAMPFEYSFLVLPIVLHKGTREELPGNTNSHMTKWIVEKPIIQAGFPARAKGLAPFVREGLRHGLGLGHLALDDDGRLVPDASKMGKLIPGSELERLVRSAAFVGRWLAKSERPATVFALFGVAP